MSSSPANSCLLFCLQLRLSPTLFSSYDLYDAMIFMFMTHARDYRHPTTITTLCPVFPSSTLPSGRYPLGGPTTLFGRSYNSLWEVLSGRWEVVFYLVRFALLALRLWPWRRSQKNKTSFEDIGVLSFAGLAVTGSVVHRLWPTTPTSAYSALLMV